MFNRRLLTLAASTFLLSSPAIAGEKLEPRVEINHRYSNDRAITMSEFWVPLAQNTEDGSVLFGDVRLMGDNNDNTEFNIGAGYRNIVDTALLGEGILGGMVWFDSRTSARGSDFNQVTVGGEWLGESWDVRVNGYIPLNDSETHTQANTNGSGSGFVGNQLLVNTDQTISEEALKGVDLELGYKLDFLDGVTDATRVYAGGYHFEGDRAEDVSGWRTRFTSDITSDIQIGARYQHDDVRGSQTYLEATLRLPFGHKKSFQEEGLRSRLDEAPERDIDIVSNEAVIDAGLTNTTLLNAQTGLAQNIIHVDNTNGAGTGTAADPFNTLAAAQVAAGVNDLIYVHRGDGTTTGMNAGIVLNDAGQMLAGSGADLKFNRDRFRTSDGQGMSQAIIKATSAPVITNGAGLGVNITADDVFVSGLQVQNTSSTGVRVRDADRVTVENMRVVNSGGQSIRVEVTDGAVRDRVILTGNTVENSNLTSISVNVVNGSFETIAVSDNLVNTPGTAGISLVTSNSSRVNNFIFDGNLVVDAGGSAVIFNARDSSVIDRAVVSNNSIFDNVGNGFSIKTSGSGVISYVDMLYGRNSMYNNSSADLSLGLGTFVDARGNYWGTGLAPSLGQVNLYNGSTVDVSRHLLIDPNQ